MSQPSGFFPGQHFLWERHFAAKKMPLIEANRGRVKPEI
jgi:hypothetical protein